MSTPATASPASVKSDSATRPAASQAERFRAVRGFTERLAEPLSAEDCGVQSMPDASPVKWHLAHTTWFFETFLLKDRPGYQPLDERFTHLFNSYYNAVGEQFTRAQRGVLSRPSLEEVLAYRRHVDAGIERLFADDAPELARVIEIGLHHEQQHQELILTDVKHALAQSPLAPAYAADAELPPTAGPSGDWIEVEEGLYEIGYDGPTGHDDPGFAFDNESPRHRVFVESFQLADALVTCREFQRFIDDGGYRRPELWLSLGWATVEEHRWRAPMYWSLDGDRWRHFTLGGSRDVDPDAPVTHVSYFEADAYARWAGARLPTEAEWEIAAPQLPSPGPFADELMTAGRVVHPGRAWQWTASPYTAYPGYTPPDGALGEYNGKFMCNQYVLRGGSCATPTGHLRPTYRNFFPPDARWQFTGVRLCR